MANAAFSRRARADLFEIDAYTIRKWGLAQAEWYLAAMDRCCRQLAEFPLMGRPWGPTHLALRRMEQGQHVIFYRKRPGGILITRILHQRMQPERHLRTSNDE